MKLNTSKVKAQKAIDLLEERVLNGEHLTIEGVVQEWYAPKSTGQYFMAKKHVSELFQVSLRRRFKIKHNLPFYRINDSGEFGIPTTEGEAKYNLNTFYKLAKGVVQAATENQKYFQTNKLLPSSKTETLTLPTSK